MKYLLSTMANAVAYTFYGEAEKGALPAVKKKITVAGGAGIPSLSLGFGEMTKDQGGTPLWTPSGRVTPISEADLELLQTHHVFKRHLDASLIEIVGNDISGNHKAVSKIAAHMADDDFAPMNNSRINKQIKVTTGESEQDSRRV